MATFGLVHGAWHGAWCWEPLVLELARRGHRAIAMDLPCEDPEAGPREYAEAAALPLADVGEPLILVGHSLGGLTIGGVAALRPVAHTVYLCALVPRPGRSWDESQVSGIAMDEGFGRDHLELRPHGGTLINAKGASEFLYNDCPPGTVERALPHLRTQTYGITGRPQLDFPATPSTYVSARRDRLVRPEWSRASVEQDLPNARWVEMAGDHSPMLGRPAELADILGAIEL